MSQIEKKKLVSIKTDDTLMETAIHGTHLFPFRFYDENMSDFDFNCMLNLNLYISKLVWFTFI